MAKLKAFDQSSQEAEPPARRFAPRKPPKPKWKNHEERVAQITGGNMTAGSGNQLHRKGDVRAKDFLVEAKQTDGAGMRVEVAWLEKISREALGDEREPALALSFDNIAHDVDRDWIMVPARLFPMVKGRTSSE